MLVRELCLVLWPEENPRGVEDSIECQWPKDSHYICLLTFEIIWGKNIYKYLHRGILRLILTPLNYSLPRYLILIVSEMIKKYQNLVFKNILKPRER